MGKRHNQIAIPTVIYCDEGIAPVVYAMNVAGIHTLFSCEGDPQAEDGETRAYVQFSTSRRRLFRLLRQLQDGWANEDLDGWEVRIEADDTYMLYVKPDFVADIAAYILARASDQPVEVNFKLKLDSRFEVASTQRTNVG